MGNSRDVNIFLFEMSNLLQVATVIVPFSFMSMKQNLNIIGVGLMMQDKIKETRKVKINPKNQHLGGRLESTPSKT